MKFTFLILLSLLPLRSFAQIYADVTVSSGDTTLGTFRVRMLHVRAPRTVANFIGLAAGTRNWIDPATGAVESGTPYYDGLVFHRLIHDFMIQGGDPLGTGVGGPGYIFQDEFDDSLRHTGPYVMSMANSGVNSNGSQFFITLAAAPHLDDKHSVFGVVVPEDDPTYPGSRALIDGFTSTTEFPTDENNRPLTPIVIESISVAGPDLAAFDVDDPAHKLPTVESVWMRLEHRGGEHFLIWNRENRHEYPVRFSGGLSAWALAGNVLSMDDLSAAEVGITPLVNAGTTFFSMPSVDYSLAPALPQNIFDTGDTVVFETEDGNLTVTFDGVGGGAWTFQENGGSLTSGNLDNVFVPEETSLPGIPITGQFINGSGSYARALSAREVTIFFDVPVGPDQLTAVQPSLSFHTGTGGWYIGPVNSNVTPPPDFKGPFTWTPAGSGP